MKQQGKPSKPWVSPDTRNYLSAYGRLQVENGIRIITSIDFCRYYQWLIFKKFPHIKTQLPRHGAHITLCSPVIHGISDFSLAKSYKGKKVEFKYSPVDIYQSKVNFWIPVVSCPIYKEMKKLLRFEEKRGWWGLHITICNSKFN
jgi:hypothetical protein